MTPRVSWRLTWDPSKGWPDGYLSVVRIEFKLFATLSEYLPAGTQGHSVAVDIPAGTTIHEVIDQFHVPRAKAHLVVVNGVYIHLSERDTYELQAGDALALWPPIAGG